MAHTASHKREERREDVSSSYDKANKPQMFTCPSCGKKTAVGKTGTAIGGGTAAGGGGGGG